MTGERNHGVSRRELLIFLYKYRLRLYLAFLIPFALAVAVSFIPVPRYKADAVLVVRMGSEYIYQPEIGSSTNGATSTIPFDGDQIFKSEVAILSSDDLHAQVIDSIGLDKLFPQLVHPVGFDLFIASVRAQIDVAMKALGLADAEENSPDYIRYKHKAKAVELFDKRFDILLEKDYAVIDLSFEHPDRHVAMGALNTLLNLYFEKRKQLYLQPRAQMAQADMKEQRSQALAAERAVENFKRAHNIYSLEDQRSDILDRREELQHRSASLISPALNEKIAAYNHQLDQLDADERQLTSLQKEAEIAESAYSLYSSKLDEAKAYDNLQRERADSVRVIQPPAVPPEPKRLQLLIILGGALVSLLCTLMVAALTEFSRSGFLTPEQAERHLGLPVLAVLPLQRRR